MFSTHNRSSVNTQRTRQQRVLHASGKYLAMLPSLAIAIAIFCFSNQPADQSTLMSDGVTELLLKIADRLHLLQIQSVDVPAICALLSTPVRKCAHMTEYLCFYLSLVFALRAWEFRGKKLLTIALAVTFFYACTDEFHQLFVPGRAGRFTDVLIDCSAATAVRLLAPRLLHRKH